MSNPETISYGLLLRRAWPIILANAAVPLLGLADTAVIGNVGSVSDLGAIAFGSLIFSFVYWSFGFLRMGTTGFTAQAAGAGDEQEVRAALGRALLMAGVLGLLLIALQWPIGAAAFALLDGSAAVEAVARDYFQIRIWGAPATLAGFACMGLLVGLGYSRQVLALQVFLNGLNIGLDVLFAGFLGLGAVGIALGTVIAEWSTLLFAAWLLRRDLLRRDASRPFWPWQRIISRAALRQTAAANLDIMIRTLLLVFSFAFFTNQSAGYGDVLLAANHILLQLISFSAFFLDGYAFVVESLVGSAKGARQLPRFDTAVRKSTLLALLSAMLLAATVFWLGGTAVALLTDLPAVRSAALDLRWLAALYVLVSFAAFQLDGIFIGVSYTRAMRNAAFLSLGCFLLAWWLLSDALGVVGLWLAMIGFVIARAVALLLYYPGLRRSIAP
ncbi:MAG: MATE family efflux transporter [Pseudohongiellaceae bacterium]